MCGIFGASLNPKMMNSGMTKAAIAKIKILGLYNQDRGRHSCGIFANNQIIKGADNLKLFSDFISVQNIPTPQESGNYTIIGHVRAATHGAQTLENAHPFLIEDDFVLAHNGVVRNIWTLCNKYGVDHKGISVDSWALAKLINQEGFSVLEQYEGFAALLMARKSEPNSIYIYRGISKRYTSGDEEEERPLFYLKCAEGMYFSSIEKPLLAISDSSDDKIEQVEGSIVHKITNGMMTKVKIPINREAVNYGVYPNNHVPPKPTGISPLATITTPTGHTSSSGTGTTPTRNTTSSTNSHVGSSFSGSRITEKIVPMIWFETLPMRATKAATDERLVFYHMGRYWMVENEAISLMHGSYRISKRGRLLESRTSASNYSNYYFYEGIMMKNEANYKKAEDDEDLKNDEWNFAMHVSKYADYPICNSQKDIATRCKGGTDFVRYRWYQNQSMCTNTGFTPRFSDRNYIIREGLLYSISTQKGTTQEMTIDSKAYVAAKAAANPDGPAVILPPFEGGTQNDLPFPEPDKSSASNTNKETDVTNFYKVYDSVDHARSVFTQLEINAMKFYIADVMAAEMGIYVDNIDDDQVDVQLNMMLQMCCDNHANIVDNWDNRGYKDILDYILIAEENPDGVYVEPVEDEDYIDLGAPGFNCGAGEACEVIPKTIPNMNVVVNNITRTDTDKLYVVDGYREDGPRYDDVDVKDDKEPSPLDVAIERIRKEMAALPSSNEVEVDEPVVSEEPMFEEFTNQEELEYAFQDIVDDLTGMRDCADELQAQESNDFAQEVANVIYREVDPILDTLHEVADRFRETKLVKYVKHAQGKRVNV